MTREKALDKVIREGLKTIELQKKGKVDNIYVLGIRRSSLSVIQACGSKGSSKKKLKK